MDTRTPLLPQRRPLARLLAAAALIGTLSACGAAEESAPPPARPALSVEVITAQSVEWPRTLTANGNVAAWQEAVIGAEIGSWRLTEVAVEVGDRVRKGQQLIRIADDTVTAELAQAKAAVAEAEAALAEAKANSERARQLKPTGAMSGQLATQYLTAEQTAQARLTAARAKVKSDELRLAQTHVLAPDDGIVSARSATLGSLAQPGQELLRLIRGGRLEWRAEVTAAELSQLLPGTPVSLTAPDGSRVTGRVRTVAPTVDRETRFGLVYVDLPTMLEGNPLRPGMFARGEFELGRAAALTVPQSAVLLRDGFSYLFRVGADDKVQQLKVRLGRRQGDQVELLEGIEPGARLVAAGVGFLADGDLVRVVPAAAQAASVSGR